MAVSEGQARPCGAAANWLVYIKRQGGTSHRILARPGWPDVLFAYHDKVTLGPTAVKVLAVKTGLQPEDL